MALEEPKPEKVEEKKETTIKYKIRPTHYFNRDSKDEWELEVLLPGIEKSAIEFKVLKDVYFLKATRDQALYAISEYFPFEVDVKTIKAKYENGLLRVTGKVKDPLADAVKIELE
jgi:HSP20 family molecular chaperone IbpA